MTEKKQITIYELLPLLKPGFVVCSQTGKWSWSKQKPELRTYHHLLGNTHAYWDVGDPFDCVILTGHLNIKKFDGDWKDSLMEVKND